MKKRFRILLAGIIAFASMEAAVGAPSKTDEEIVYRQSVLTVIGRAFGGVLGGIAKGERPYDQAEALKAARLVDSLSTLPFDSFGPGTDKGAPNKASPKIWQDPAAFRAAAEKFQIAAAQLPAAAGDPAALKAQVLETSKTCKACHDEFRVK